MCKIARTRILNLKYLQRQFNRLPGDYIILTTVVRKFNLIFNLNLSLWNWIYFNFYDFISGEDRNLLFTVRYKTPTSEKDFIILLLRLLISNFLINSIIKFILTFSWNSIHKRIDTGLLVCKCRCFLFYFYFTSFFLEEKGL